MAFATIAGVTYEVEVEGASHTYAVARAFDGTPLQTALSGRMTVLGVAGVGARLSEAEYATLRTNINAAAVTVSGNAFRGLTSVRVNTADDVETRRKAAGVQVFRPSLVWSEPV